MALAFWLTFVFLVGASIGSFLNVAIARLPLEKSLLWPDSRCGSCLQSIAWYDNVPLISYLWLRGQCRHCGARFSIAYLLVELFTALGFVGLFLIEAEANVHGWPTRFGWYAWPTVIGFAWHATLFSFLTAASVCDLKSREIPLQLTMTGTLVGLIGATLMPWPWPGHGLVVPTPAPGLPWQNPGVPLHEGIYAWPFWGPLPSWAGPEDWQTGLLTGVCGALMGTLLLRITGFLFSAGLGKEALGLGDADLMMMAGAFLGWQMVLVAFFLSVAPALLFGIIQLMVRRDNSLPFGPSLSIGVMATCLAWGPIGVHLRPVLFSADVLVLGRRTVRDHDVRHELRDAAISRKRGARDVKPILIVDYGMANLRSVQKAFEKVGAAAIISDDPNAIADADKLVLPGVGAFRDAIARLREADFVQPIKEHVASGKPFFGICLGLQLLFTRSHEDGVIKGSICFPAKWCALRTCGD